MPDSEKPIGLSGETVRNNVNRLNNSATLTITKSLVFFADIWKSSASDIVGQGHAVVIWAIGCKSDTRGSESKFKMIHQSAPTQTPRYRVGVPYVSTTGQFPHGRDSTRCWKAFRGKWAHAYWRASLSSCRFVSRMSMTKQSEEKLNKVLCFQSMTAAGLQPPQFWDYVWYAIMYNQYACDKLQTVAIEKMHTVHENQGKDTCNAIKLHSVSSVDIRNIFIILPSACSDTNIGFIITRNSFLPAAF